MATKKFFSWSSKSRHQSTQEKEPHYRTGGLLSIDALTSDPSPGDREPVREFNLPQDAKINSLSARKRPANLTIVPPNYETNQHAYLGSAAAPQNTALSSSTSNLLSFMNDMLRSPSPAANRSRSSSTVQKPLPGRPRSLSAPSTPDLPVELPVELPGSILQENQGYPSNPPSEGTSSRPISQQYRCDTEPPVDLEWLPPVDTDWLSQDFYDSFGITSDSLRQAKSVQDLSSLTVNMKSVRSGTTLNSSAASLKRHSSKSQHKRSLSETSVRGISRPNLTSNSSTDSKLTTCSVSSTKSSSNDSTKARVGAAKSLQPSPLIEEDQNWDKSNEEDLKHRAELDASTTSTPTPTPTPSIRRNSARVDELKATITAQDNTISTLQAQFGSLRASHEAHVASLADAHSAEVASLKSYTKALEEQLSQRSLHHASSNNLLFLLDTTDPQTPSRDGSQKSMGSGSATSAKSFQSALEQQGRSPSRETTEMENLKRKLSAARRPETGNRDAIRELNLFKQNNLALSKQIESLMAKLNESKQNERSLQKKLEELEKSGTESQESASKAEELEKANAALQNTVDHLEHRLEMANVDKLDAEEQLFIFTSKKSPFDLKSPRSQSAAPEKDRTQASHLSMSTIFSSDSPIGPNESQEPTTLAAFVAHIERLQEQIKEKDARIEELETENDGLQLSRAQVEMEMKGLSPQLDMLNKKSKQNEVHIEQLRTAIIDRESIIGEKEKAIRAVERQLEHHKLLLQAEIRKHATMSIMANSQAEPLPDLNSLASKADIDRWIERLQTRLKKDKGIGGKKDTPQSPEDAIGDLRKEIDFYIHEIIYYKLDIKGYKSDIKKLKHASRASRMSDMDSIKSNTPSLAPSGDTPINARFPSGASGLGISTSPSPVSTGPISATISIGRPITPPLTIMTPEASPKKDTAKMITMTAKRVPQQLTLKAPATPQTPKTPPCHPGVNIANEADNIDPGISPRSIARLSPERRKPTPPSPDQEKFGELATNFPLSTPASPKKHPTQRSLSESIIKLCSTPRTPERSPASRKEVTTGGGGKRVQFRGRSASVPDASKAKTTPERPPRPRYGLFDSPVATGAIAPSDPPSPPRMDVLAEAMRHSPDQNKPSLRVPLERGLSNSSGSAMSAPSPDKHRPSLASPKSLVPSPLALRPCAGSAESKTASIQPLISSPERKLSSSSSSNTPFVISMGSPHNPALIQPITTIQPTTCSITAKSSSLKVTSPTSRTGLCGTMASSMQTPSPKPTATQTSKALPPPPTGTASTTASQSQPQPRPTLPLIPRSRNGSISSMTKRKAVPSNNKNEPVAPRTLGHSRNASAPGSFRSAMQLSGSLSLIKGKGKSRKESLTAGASVGRSMSISHPRPLASPFDIDRPVDDGRNSKNDEGKVIGMAV